MEMKIGFAKRSITPPPGTELGGYAGYRPCSGCHDPLWCRAVVLQQGQERRALLSLELRSLYGINKLRYTRDEKTKRRYQGLALVWVLVIGVVFFYVGGLVYGLCSLGLAGIVPAYLCVLASLLILAFGLFTSGSRLFGARGYDLLASMPISSGKLVLSRFLGLYAEDLVFSAVILVPGIGVYAY